MGYFGISRSGGALLKATIRGARLTYDPEAVMSFGCCGELMESTLDDRASTSGEAEQMFWTRDRRAT